MREADQRYRVCIASAYALALTVGIIGRLISCKLPEHPSASNLY